MTEGDGVVEFTATRTGTVGGAGCIGVAVVDISTQGRAPLHNQVILPFLVGFRSRQFAPPPIDSKTVNL